MLYCDARDGRPSTNEKQRTGVELVESLEGIPLNGSRLDRTTRIGTLASRTIRLALATFLKKN